MRLGFRISITLVASLAVLLSVAVTLVYGIPAAQKRLSAHAKSITLAQAAATADAITSSDQARWSRLLGVSGRTGSSGGSRPLQRSLTLYTGPSRAQVMVVNRRGEVVAREGSVGFSAGRGLVRAAANGRRTFERAGGYDVAVVPIVYRGRFGGGIIFATRNTGTAIYQIFLRSSLEAALVALIVSGGVALLLATVLGRKVERLMLGARSIARGDLSYRLTSRYSGELGELARAFNSMADRLEESFAELKEGRETLRAILENLSEGVLATDPKGRVMFANRAIRHMLGLGDEAEFERVPDPWEDFDLPGAVARCAGQEERIEAMVHEGETFLRANVVHMPVSERHAGGALVVLQDLSEGRRLEANQQRFIANAAHALKTPITSIMGAAELLLSGDDEDPEVRGRFLEHISSEARKMQQLSDTLLRMARTGFEWEHPNIQAVDPEVVAESAVAQMSPLAERCGVELAVTGEPRKVLADKERLERALLIMLHNAVKHSSKGDTVTVRLCRDTVVVEDEGEGITEKDLPHVFERFYQGSGSAEGFGLGLSICKEIVESIDGEISISSEEGRGTNVTLKLPPAGGGEVFG